MKPLDGVVQRTEGYEDEEEEIRMQPLVQLKGASAGGAASPELEQSIQQERGKGQPLAESIRQPMENVFGANFGSVRIHTDNTADQLNQSIQAKAFTTGQDVFFRQGAYAPESKGGQELLAHELTHVVQQSGNNGSDCMKSGLISRKLNVQDTQWDRVRQIYSSGKGGGGVLMFADKVGDRQIIVKPGVKGAEEMAMASLMSGVNSSNDTWQIGTPDIRIMAPDEAQAVSQQMQKGIFQDTLVAEGDRVSQLLGNMARGDIGDMMVTSLAKGDELGDMLADSQGQDHIKTGDKRFGTDKDKVKSDSPLKLFMDNSFIKALGRMAAVDIFLGNWDRLADKFNPENLFIKKNMSGGKITGIDNSGEVGMLATHGGIENWLNHLTGLPQMMIAGNYEQMAHVLLVTDNRGYDASNSPILQTLMQGLISGNMPGLSNRFNANEGKPQLRTDGKINRNPQVVAVREKLNAHMVEMSDYLAQGIEQGVARLKNLPVPDLDAYQDGDLAQQNYIARLQQLQ
ncbi:MAG: DUF4157 domain-containing protein [Spirulina sp. SIO3F2]|nr:DUF4157 domain-containing protein [Spirulina sp. SIO3F2]